MNTFKQSNQLVALVSQLAFHRMFQYPPFTSTQVLIRTADRVARQAYKQSVICHSMHVLGHPLFKQLRCKVVQSKRFSSFARELSLLSHNSQWSIPYNKVQNFNKCFNFFSKHNLRGFYDIVRDYKKSLVNNYKHYRKLIQ